MVSAIMESYGIIVGKTVCTAAMEKIMQRCNCMVTVESDLDE